MGLVSDFRESLISFDPFCPLIGEWERSGFRLYTERVDFIEALNFLSDNFGEGYENEGAISNDRWNLRNGWRFFHELERKKPWGIRLIIYEKEILDAFMENFKLTIPFDDSNTIGFMVRDAIKPLHFSRVNDRRIRKMKHLVAKALPRSHKLQWYDINYDSKNSIISFVLKNTKFSIKL